MDELVLVGASGLAREVLAAVRSHGSLTVTGVLDDDPSLHGSTLDQVTVLGGLEELRRHPDAQVLLCPGRGAARRRLVDRLGLDATRYARLDATGQGLAADTEMAPGAIVLRGTVATTNVTIGAHAVIMPNVVLTHDDVVGDFATLAAGVVLGGSVQVGEGAYLGMASSVRQGVRVGADAVLGMGAVLLEDLPAGETWAGVPARPITVRSK